MAGQLAAMPEETTDGSPDACPPTNLYRDSIRSVALPYIRSTLFAHSGQSGSSFSGASSYYPSVQQLWLLLGPWLGIRSYPGARGYLQHQKFDGRRSQDAAGHGGTGRSSKTMTRGLSRFCEEEARVPGEGINCLSTRDLVDKWIRALAVIVASITDLLFVFETPAAVVPFGKASIAQMLDVVDVIITVLEAEKLQLVLDIFTCVCDALHVFTSLVFSSEIYSIFKGIRSLLEKQENTLSNIIGSTMWELRTLVKEDDSWALEISRGGGEVHKNTRFIMDCIVSMMNARTSTQSSAPSRSSENLGFLIDVTIDYLKDLSFLTRATSHFRLNVMWCLSHQDLSFLTRGTSRFRLNVMDSYLDVSWGHVLSCITKSRFPGPIHCWINTSSLAKFESAFHKMYQAQKLWKVPDPQLRDSLRRAIIERVISGYRDYLKEHPELKKHVGRESSSPEVLQAMLGELFEG
ncbi:hypothetical protein D1007_60172 [Hordeum vulgare]|nr:hypothetical protein D1007_60172 [Hordeum vulgare]